MVGVDPDKSGSSKSGPNGFTVVATCMDRRIKDKEFFRQKLKLGARPYVSANAGAYMTDDQLRSAAVLSKHGVTHFVVVPHTDCGAMKHYTANPEDNPDKHPLKPNQALEVALSTVENDERLSFSQENGTLRGFIYDVNSHELYSRLPDEFLPIGAEYVEKKARDDWKEKKTEIFENLSFMERSTRKLEKATQSKGSDARNEINRRYYNMALVNQYNKTDEGRAKPIEVIR